MKPQGDDPPVRWRGGQRLLERLVRRVRVLRRRFVLRTRQFLLRHDVPPDVPSVRDLRPRTWSGWVWVNARRLVVLVLGLTVVLIGVAMMVLPGPATVVIPLGIAILATEFAWARWLLRKARQQTLVWLEQWARYEAQANRPR